METKPRGKRRRLFLFQLIFVIGLLSLVWYGFGSNVLAPANQSIAPDYLGSLHLVSVIEGAEAMARINQLHGTTIDLVSAYIAEYANDREHATIWVGEAESQEVAADLTRRMVEGIQKGNTGFTNLRQLPVAGHEVWQVDGRDGKFFFYNSWKYNNRVVWLTIEATDAMPILELAIKALE